MWSALSSRSGQVVLDVGAGKTCSFAVDEDRVNAAYVVALDVAFDELILNYEASQRVVCDVMEGIPLGPDSADLVVSRSVLEHLPDVDRFVEEAHRVLRPGGKFVHLFPGRYSTFALASRMLGPKLSQRVLFFFSPHARETSGFRAFYDRTYFTAIRECLVVRGFSVYRIEQSFYGSEYYAFLFPLYLLSVLYELFLYLFRLKNMAAYYLVVGEKR